MPNVSPGRATSSPNTALARATSSPVLRSYATWRIASRRSARVAFPERLIAVLEAGQRAGGDTRGQQSAALLVVSEGGGFAGYSDRVVDLRVDDHVTPIAELARLLRLHRETFG